MASFGETLKRERELREISLRQISEATKINIRYLEALEGNRFDALPGGLFNKGFIRAYAKFIGLDGEAMVNAYLEETTGRQRGSDSSAAGARASSNVHRPTEVPLRRASGAAWNEGAERGNRGEHTERAERGERPERGEHAERAERTERPERGEHDERAERAERPDRAERGERAARGQAPAPASAAALAPAPAAPKHRPKNDRSTVAAALAELVNAKPAGGGRAAAPTEDIQPHPAVTGIEVADSQEPASSRVLVWVLSLVAAAGVLFLIVSLMRGPSTTPGRSADGSSVQEGNPPGGNPPGVQGEGGAMVPGGAGDTSAVPPEVTSQSPLTIGGIAAGAQRPTPSTSPGLAAAGAGSAGTPLVGTESAPAAPARAGSAGPEVMLAPVKPVPKPVAQKTIAPPPPATPQPSPTPELDRRERARMRGPMKFEIEAVGETHVIVSCDGSEVLNRIMEAGETERARCDSVVRVSAADAGAVRASVNGQACLPLGEPGMRSFGYTIRIDDFPRICPVAGRDDDVRP